MQEFVVWEFYEGLIRIEGPMLVTSIFFLCMYMGSVIVAIATRVLNNLCKKHVNIHLPNCDLLICCINTLFMPPTSEKLRGHIGLGLSIHLSVHS